MSRRIINISGRVLMKLFFGALIYVAFFDIIIQPFPADCCYSVCLTPGGSDSWSYLDFMGH